MRAAATLGTRAVAGARGHARMRKSEPVNVSRGSDSILTQARGLQSVRCGARAGVCMRWGGYWSGYRRVVSDAWRFV